jgi:hypothetical protein
MGAAELREPGHGNPPHGPPLPVTLGADSVSGGKGRVCGLGGEPVTLDSHRQGQVGGIAVRLTDRR